MFLSSSNILPASAIKTARGEEPADQASTGSSQVHKTYSSWRWYILFVYSLSHFVTSLHGSIFNPINTVFNAVYGTDQNELNVIQQIAMFVALVFTFPAMFFVDRRHYVESAFFQPLIVTCAMSWLRAYGPVAGRAGYINAVVTQVFISIAQPFLLVLAARISAIYFPVHQRVISTGVSTIVGLIGTGAGVLLSPLFFTDIHKNSALPSEEELIERIRYIFLVQAAAPTACLVLSLFAFEPRKALWCFRRDDDQVTSKGHMTEPLLHLIKRTAKNKSLMVLLFAIFFCQGVANTQIQLAHAACMPSFCGYDQEIMITLVLFATGIIGGFVASIVVGKFDLDYITALRCLIILSVCGNFGMNVAWYLDSYVGVLISGAFFAFAIFGAFAIVIELGVEYAYVPQYQSEATVVGLFSVFVTLATIIGVSMATPGNIFSAKTDAIFFFVTYSIGAFLIFLLPRDYKRMQYFESGLTDNSDCDEPVVGSRSSPGVDF